MKNQISSLTITTKISHLPKDVHRFRAQIIEHVLITFLLQLKPKHPKLFAGIDAQQILNRIFHKNNGNLSSFKEEQLDHIVSLLYHTYPDLIYFHNHHPNGSANHIAYPLIHYRSKKGKAIIQAFEAAIPIVEQWLSVADWQSWISYGHVSDKQLEQQVIKVTQQPMYYRLMDWLPLNSEAYQLWQQAHTLQERAVLLDRAITGHVRRLAQSFIKDQEWPELIGASCMIRKIKRVKGYHHPDIALNVIFRTNMLIPPSLAIGRSVSLGYGTQSLTAWQEHQLSTQEEEELVTVFV